MHSQDWLACIARDLAKKGNEVTIIDQMYSRNDQIVELSHGVRVVRLSVFGRSYDTWRRHSSLKAVERLAWSIISSLSVAKLNADVILSTYNWGALFLIHSSPKLRRRLIMYSMSLYSPGPQGPMNNLRIRTEVYLGQNTALTVCENELQARSLKDAGLPARRTKVLEPAVDTDYWKPSGDTEAAKRKLGLHPDWKVILFHARIVRRKGTCDLIRAANLLNSAHMRYNLVYVIVGPPTEGTVPTKNELAYLDHLSQLIRDFKLEKMVYLIPSWQPSSMLKDYYDACDLYVLPTSLDMAPHSIKQAMAMGKPVVTTNIGWIPTLVDNRENGLLVRPGEIKSLADAIGMLINNESLRDSMGSQNLLKVAKNWRLDKFQSRWETLLLEVNRNLQDARGK